VQATDLRERRVGIERLRGRHRLHRDGRAAADQDAADVDLLLAGHWAESYLPTVR
jgi:hypothetical protein